MDLELTEAQRGARDVARRFSREKLGRSASKPTDRIAIRLRRSTSLRNSGCSVSFIPEQYGGAGLDHVSYALVIEEIAVECASTGGDRVGPLLARHHGRFWARNRAQKKHFLPEMATGEWLGCFALTEPQAGSDAAGQKTRAVLDGDSLRYQRHQEFHHQRAAMPKVAIVFAMTQTDKGHHGISAFMRSRPKRPDGR